MAAAPAKISSTAAKRAAESKGVVLEQVANEFVFAVVGHVGSGTSEIATALKGLLSGATGGSFDFEILKAREVIRAWAANAGLQTPTTEDNDPGTVQALQDLGDSMRFDTRDYATVAKELIVKIRRIRADKTGIKVRAFGNIFNNRTEEAIGTAHDLWTAYREGAFGKQPRPFVGWMMLVEDAPASGSVVRDKSPHFPVFPEFQGASYLKRYDILCQRLIQEQLYTTASIITSPRTAADTGEYAELSEMTSLKTFITSLAGHVAAEAVRTAS